MGFLHGRGDKRTTFVERIKVQLLCKLFLRADCQFELSLQIDNLVSQKLFRRTNKMPVQFLNQWEFFTNCVFLVSVNPG